MKLKIEILKALNVRKVITSELKEIWSGLTEDGRGGRRHTLIVGEAQVGDEVLFKMKCERGGVVFGY